MDSNCDDGPNKRQKTPCSNFADELICPITLELPYDPVTAEDGNIYERSAIVQHIKAQEEAKEQLKSPITNQPMGNKLLASTQIKNLIEKSIKSKVISGELAENWIEKQAGEEDFERMKRQAASGDLDQMRELALCYYNEKKNYKLSYDWYKKAADKRHVKAMGGVGCLLLNGEGVEQNIPEGMYYLVSAAEQGSNAASKTLGDIYSKGLFGCPIDKERAIYWYNKSLDANMPFQHMSDKMIKETRDNLQQLKES